MFAMHSDSFLSSGSVPTSVMLLPRRQSDKSAAASNKFCSIRTLNGLYAEFGIDPAQWSKPNRRWCSLAMLGVPFQLFHACLVKERPP